MRDIADIKKEILESEIRLNEVIREEKEKGYRQSLLKRRLDEKIHWLKWALGYDGIEAIEVKYE